MTLQDVISASRKVSNAGLSQPFLFWLAFVLRRYANKEGELAVGPNFVAGISKRINRHFPFADPTPSDVATFYCDFWFRSQAIILPVPVNIIVGYIALVAGMEQAVSTLERALELDVTGSWHSEILEEVSRRDAIPLAYRILVLYCDNLSKETRADIRELLRRWLEFEREASLRRIDQIDQCLGYLSE